MSAIAFMTPILAAPAAQITIKDFVRLRCGLDHSEAYTTWTGTLYSDVPQEKQRALFGLTGVNVASCFQDVNGSWFFSSRELMYYTDLTSGQPLDSWSNPWTGEVVPVMHVANSPVQGEFGSPDAAMGAELLAGGAIISSVSDVNLFYPNPLYANASYAPYAPQQWYEGGEFFKFFVDAAEIGGDSPTIEKMWFSWERNGQWLPWMRMGDHVGGVFCSTVGSRSSFNALPDFIRTDIATRLPLYEHAPGCLQDIPDSTSWTYFATHFDAYLRDVDAPGAVQFPVAAPIPQEPVPCKFAPQ